MPALYIHIPFCVARCPYCDFNSYVGLEALYEPYCAALTAEIRRAGARYGRPRATTLFIGGGTPTVLPLTLLAQVLDACRSAFDLAGDAEITCEANPGTVDQHSFSGLRNLGVNRLSLGVQSFDDDELRWLGRIHSAAEARAAFHAGRRAGFDNINLDLIFGLPHQDPRIWARTLSQALALCPEHLSLYSLTVEPGTPLATRVSQGLEASPDDDLAAQLYEVGCATLAAAGYEHYEISNWARGMRLDEPSPFVCRHNLTYWHAEPYLGFGAGAHSYMTEGDTSRVGQRWWNVASVEEYICRVETGQSPVADGEVIDRRLAMGEVMMLGLRLVQEGVTDERFRSRFGCELEEVFGDEIRDLVGRGLLERLPDRVRLTRQGCLLGNQVFAAFLPG